MNSLGPRTHGAQGAYETSKKHKTYKIYIPNHVLLEPTGKPVEDLFQSPFGFSEYSGKQGGFNVAAGLNGNEAQSHMGLNPIPYGIEPNFNPIWD